MLGWVSFLIRVKKSTPRSALSYLNNDVKGNGIIALGFLNPLDG